MRLRRRQRRARQKLRHADHAVHRRAQLVTHAIEEVALRLCGFGELPVAFTKLACAQLHFGLEPRASLDHLLELLPVAVISLRGEPEQRERVDRIGERRSPGCRIAVDRELQRRRAPDGIRVRRAHLEHVIAGIQVRQRDAALAAEIDPVVGQARHAVGEPVVRRRREVQHSEIEGNNRAAIVERHAVA